MNLSLLVIDESEENHLEIRSFGCNGMKSRNEYRCRTHCRNFGYRNGRCSELSKYHQCVCYKTLPDQSKQQKKVLLNNNTSLLFH